MSARETFASRSGAVIDDLRKTGQYKALHTVSSPMGPVATIDGREVIVLCSNDYLGLASDPRVVEAGIDALKTRGAGTASVRFICGTFDVHHEIERALAAMSSAESALTFVSCWNANEALFPTVMATGDTVISDALNHASIIDAIRQSRDVERKIYAHNDLAELEAALKGASTSGIRWVTTDGVFSMEGDLARLPEILVLCRTYDALLVVDDSHGVGVLGETGHGTAEHYGLAGSVDVTTGTLGKALGGAAGGYVASSGELIDLLIQRARPSLFSNALPATVARSARRAIEILNSESERVGRLRANAAQIRERLRDLGYEIEDSPSAIVPIILGDAVEVERASKKLLDSGVLVVGFSYPVVPVGKARLRIQASAGLTDEHLDQVIAAFARL
ncbi:MAG: aminotransferase class I/II-fold pyridoxal phosphate-dependent enzyme [Acidimicrobiales bacterium]